MESKMSKFLVLCFSLMCILSLTSTPKTTASPTPVISVVPARNAFTTDTTTVGDTFTVNITTSGWEDPGLYSYELKLFFDPELLSAIEAVYPPGHFVPPPNFEVPIEINAEAGYVLFGVTKLGEVPGSTGSGVLATVTFEIAKAPPPDLSCDLELGDVILLDPDGNEYTDFILEHGYYEFTLPKAPVYMKVSPETIGAATAGQIVRVDITINDLRTEDKFTAVEWKLRYDPEFLELVDAAEGNFLKSEAEEAGPEYGTAFHCVSDPGTNFVRCFSLYYRDPWPPEIFPEGSGVLATVTFNATVMPENLTSITLELYDVVMLDVDGNPIRYSYVESGEYIAPAEPGDLNYDMIINIQDLYIFGKAFGSHPGHPRWDSRADLNGDGKVNIIDGTIIAKSFHT